MFDIINKGSEARLEIQVSGNSAVTVRCADFEATAHPGGTIELTIPAGETAFINDDEEEYE